MDVLDLLRELMRLEPPVHLFGGYAEDALLHGRVSRPHVDVDVIVLRDELPLRLEQGRRLGFRDYRVRFEPRPGLPLVVGAIEGPLNLELIVFDRAPDGRVYFDTPTPRGLKRVWLPEGAFDPTPRTLEGVELRTLSPLALHQLREAVAETFGGMRPKDRVAQAGLRRTFFQGFSDADLAPREERLEEEPLRLRPVRAAPRPHAQR